MDVLLTERQLSELKKLLEQDATADPAAQAPTAGTSSKQAGGQGYPEVGKWESGVTRGPANQVGITKWADVVGSKLNRGKANPLKEQDGDYKKGYPVIRGRGTIVNPKKNTYVKPSNPDDPDIEYLNTPVLIYKTFWGDDIRVPGSGMATVVEWQDTDFRQLLWSNVYQNPDTGEVTWLRSYKDKKTNERTWHAADTPTEESLREVFPNNTVGSITTNVDGVTYAIHFYYDQKEGWQPRIGYFSNNGTAYNADLYLYKAWETKVTEWLEDNWVFVLEITASIIAGIATGGAALWIRALAQVGVSLGATGLGLIIKGNESNLGLAVNILIASLPFTSWGLKIGVKGPLKMLTKYGAELATAKSKIGILRVIAKIEDPIEKRLVLRIFKEAPAELVKEVKTVVAKGFVKEVEKGSIKLSMIPLKYQGWWKQTLFEVGGGVTLAAFGEPLIDKILKKLKLKKSNTMDNAEIVNLTTEIQKRLEKYSDDVLSGVFDPVIDQYSKLAEGSEEDQVKFLKINKFILDEYDKDHSSDLKKLVKDNYNTIIK